jgi:fused signal recognition particle receptor
MFSFFKRKPKTPPPQEVPEQVAPAPIAEISPPPVPAAPPPAAIPAAADNAAAPVAPPATRPAESQPLVTPQTRPEPVAPAPSAPAQAAASEPAKPEPAKPEPEKPASNPGVSALTSTAAEEVEIVPAASEQEKRSWFSRLKTGLSKTSSNLSTLFVGAKIDDDLYDELEAALLMADAGVEATQTLLDNLKRRVKEQKLTQAEQVKSALRDLLVELLKPLERPLVLGRHQPTVMMIAGVNGAGKTTTIGKLAKHMQQHGQSVLLAAGDTFRAAAREQLTIWGERNNVHVISQESGDPAAVSFDAVQSAQARGTNVVMIDTAGRLPTQLHLMEELRKVKRVIAKGMADAPHEVLLVIDGNTGQNAVAQVKAFDDALGLTGLIVTKLDGTAKGGVLAAIVKARPVPVYFVGVGEKIEDLQPFVARDFADALLGLAHD